MLVSVCALPDGEVSTVLKYLSVLVYKTVNDVTLATPTINGTMRPQEGRQCLVYHSLAENHSRSRQTGGAPCQFQRF